VAALEERQDVATLQLAADGYVGSGTSEIAAKLKGLLENSAL
jgi:hypothetical protein